MCEFWWICPPLNVFGGLPPKTHTCPGVKYNHVLRNIRILVDEDTFGHLKYYVSRNIREVIRNLAIKCP